jgi:hypothetical protein
MAGTPAECWLDNGQNFFLLETLCFYPKTRRFLGDQVYVAFKDALIPLSIFLECVALLGYNAFCEDPFPNF